MKKYRFISLIAVTAIVLSFAFRPAITDPDLSNMVLTKGLTYSRGLDSLQLKNLMDRFEKPRSFFSQEFPIMRITVASFYIDKYEVTNADYKKFIDANPRWLKGNIPDSLQSGDYLKDWNGNKYPKGNANYPVVYICWYAANAYAKWAGKRLPTEAEWECVAKEIAPEAYDSHGNAEAYPDDAGFAPATDHPEPVGKHKPNSLGVYDLYGNVSEFCQDRWRQDSYFKTSMTTRDRSFAIQHYEANQVVIRGGNLESPPVDRRVTFRESFSITACSAKVGFRCVANARPLAR